MFEFYISGKQVHHGRLVNAEKLFFVRNFRMKELIYIVPRGISFQIVNTEKVLCTKSTEWHERQFLRVLATAPSIDQVWNYFARDVT